MNPVKRASIKCIRLKGARQNNLKGFDLDVPLGKFIVVTGLSGSGKSSLVFETLHAEGQRRYVETFSPYARQFLEMMDRPDVQGIENVRPSIAIEQRNTVKTSRSTIGTMTELCDFFKVWFCHLSCLYDPISGKRIEDDNPQSIWKKALKDWPGETILLTFLVNRPHNSPWDPVRNALLRQGYNRILTDGRTRKLECLEPDEFPSQAISVIQDRLRLEPGAKVRFIDSAQTALRFGRGTMQLHDGSGDLLASYSEGLQSPLSGRRFRRPSPALFSFNSPVGACSQCRGFGRIIEIDDRLVIPDRTRSINQGVVKAFQGSIYGQSHLDLEKACQREKIPLDVPFDQLPPEDRKFVIEGDPSYGAEGKRSPNAWYGVRRFFKWLEGNVYKMHVRVFLSKFRAYTRCPACQGDRLQSESLNWKWRGRTLPELYRLPIGDLLSLMERHPQAAGHRQADIAADSILTRLRYLDQVGLGYLTLDRTSRTLSGGEAKRVSLTSCLGSSLVDTLFVLDEPSIGLHSRDIHRLIGILERLARQGNTVIVVEHDETIIRAADEVIELGPKPGIEGGRLIYHGDIDGLCHREDSVTANYLSGRATIERPDRRRSVSRNGGSDHAGASRQASLRISGASKHNLRDLSVCLPLERFVAVSGVSGSGKSTLLDNTIYQGLRSASGKAVQDPASMRRIESDIEFSEILLVDQTALSRTPRSNAAIFSGAWNLIRELFATTDRARSSGLTPSSFSFNSGDGRCQLCNGRGYERVEMQFMADAFVTCPSCSGQRFQPEILAVTYRDRSIADILRMNTSEAACFFVDHPKIHARLTTLLKVGLGYLPLGQPLNTLSGGESQRLKLVRYLSRFDGASHPALLLLDEPTTGLHRHDVKGLISVLQEIVDRGHSLIVIEHHLDILKSADWVIEMGPGAGSDGGRVICAGAPEDISRHAGPTAPFLREALRQFDRSAPEARQFLENEPNRHTRGEKGDSPLPAYSSRATRELIAADPAASYRHERQTSIQLVGARENNLRNLSVTFPLGKISVITGVSGSGKTTLAFDTIFAEGQRRFMESMSPYARQFVEQIPRPEIDLITGIPPTVAIEQRVTHGTRKSTVATITEVAQYLRLLYARIGVQHSRKTGLPLIAQDVPALVDRLLELIAAHKSKYSSNLYLCAPLVRGRKGHHQPLADWVADHGYEILRIDGHFVRIAHFQKLDRYREHDIEVVVEHIRPREDTKVAEYRQLLKRALKLGRGACLLMTTRGRTVAWLSTKKTDPSTGQSYPELDPKHFSWNSPKGWCPSCRGNGSIARWMQGHSEYPDEIKRLDVGSPCPGCRGGRLNEISSSVYLHFEDGEHLSLPDLLKLTPKALLGRLRSLKLDGRGRAIVKDLLSEIVERLSFIKRVGLDYLAMDRSTVTLSGGEAQRIRLAAHLGSNLSGVLYVLDEPSIGLHASDNARLLSSLRDLRRKGNTLLIVEHDEQTMQEADCIVDLGPGAGLHGGSVLARGTLESIVGNEASLTGQYLRKGISHPSRGSYRALPTRYPVHSSKGNSEWLILEKASLRNLKGDDLFLPIGKLIMVCGISGAGKSTLVRDLLRPAVTHASKSDNRSLQGRNFTESGAIVTGRRDRPVFKRLLNGNRFRRVIEVDQSPIGKTPRSTPATYTGVFGIIRNLLGTLPEARMLGHSPSTYSFNTKTGRCEECKGAGRIKLAMNFMPDTYVVCEECEGSRYGKELEDIRWRGKNVAEVLEMSFETAAEFFSFHRRLHGILTLMVEAGLGYLTLGQSSPTLSGGEAQRLKLVSELAKGLQSSADFSKGVVPANLYILEEPTIGLHLADCEILIGVLHRLVDQGHTVIVIEHHIDLIAEADYVVEIGPGGGDAGGEILYQGTVGGLRKCAVSPTAPYLREKIG